MNMPAGAFPFKGAATQYERSACTRAKNSPRSRNGKCVASTTCSAVILTAVRVDPHREPPR